MTDPAPAPPSEITWRPSHADRSAASTRHVLPAVAIAAVGLALACGALPIDQAWFDRHFLPSFFLPRRWYWFIVEVVRGLLVLAGVGLVVIARPLATRLTTRRLWLALHLAIAAVLALGCAELALRWVQVRPTEWLFPGEEPRRRADARLGWTLVPGRTGHASVGGRAIAYAIDGNGYRVRSAAEATDLTRPTIVCIGESVMFGEGLNWDETIPAQVGEMTGIQAANLAVHGYSTDQAYMRLADELPRFERPVAVVSLFMTALFGRNLDDDRPHLGPGLVWLPTELHARLRTLAMILVPYRRDDAVRRAISRTREVLRATVNLARSRGASSLVVVPQLGAETEAERNLRLSILDAEGVPYVFVQVDDTWRLSWDRHPNARASRVIAAAVAARLRSSR